MSSPQQNTMNVWSSKFTRLPATFFLYSGMNVRKKNPGKNVCERRRDRRKSERERDELFLFCLLPKCSIRLLFTSRHRVEVKKMERTEKSRVQRREHYVASLYACVCVFVFFILSLFFCVCVRARAFGVCKYIHTSESRQIEKREKRGKKLPPKTNGKHTNSAILSRC